MIKYSFYCWRETLLVCAYKRAIIFTELVYNDSRTLNSRPHNRCPFNFCYTACIHITLYSMQHSETEL